MKQDDIVTIDKALNAIEASMRKDVGADPQVREAQARVVAAEERLGRVYRKALARKKRETLIELADDERFEAVLAQAVSHGWSAEEIILTRKYLMGTSLAQLRKPVPGPAGPFPSMAEPIFARPKEIDK